MVKWADYVITAVKFKKEKRHIEQVKLMKDNGEKLDYEQIASRIEVVQFLNSGITFVTAYKNIQNKWQKGDNVSVVQINNIKFIRTDGNNVEEDNLGELPEF
jgi:hypothetical protein